MADLEQFRHTVINTEFLIVALPALALGTISMADALKPKTIANHISPSAISEQPGNALLGEDHSIIVRPALALNHSKNLPLIGY